MSEPQVSVLMLVYEHEKFVAQAIQSVLTQQCDFPFELIIINDCSSDGSAEICSSIAASAPTKVTFIDNHSNIGMHNSFEKLWNVSSAPLIAFCEGDDFWVDNLKLQKQVDLMRQNPRWDLCGANAQVIELSKEGVWEIKNYLKPLIAQSEYSFEELISAYHFHFSTVIIRKRSVRFPSWFKSVYCVDRPIYLLAVEDSVAGYLNHVVSAYRIHSGGNWSSISSLNKAAQSTDLFTKLALHFDKKYMAKFEITLFNILQTYVAVEMHGERYENARHIFKMAFSRLGFRARLRCIKKYYRTAILLLIRR